MILRKIVTVLLLFSFIWKIGMVLSIQINYFINKKEITEKYCKNKEKPKLQCNGKCHLKKQLEKIEPKETKSDKKQSPTLTFKVEDQFFSPIELVCNTFQPEKISNQNTYYYFNQYCFQFIQDLKTPPQKYLV